MSVQLNMMVLRDNTEFKLASLRSVEQVSGLKKKKPNQKRVLQGRILMFLLKSPEIP